MRLKILLCYYNYYTVQIDTFFTYILWIKLEKDYEYNSHTLEYSRSE